MTSVFIYDALGFTELPFSVQPNPFGTTETCHSVPPISQQEKQFATYSIFLLIQLHSMNLVLYKHHNFIQCFVLLPQDQTHSQQIPENPSWKLMSKGEREITSKVIIREREIYKGESTKGERILKDPIY